MQLEIFKKAVELNMKDIFIMMRARSTISFAICFLINTNIHQLWLCARTTPREMENWTVAHATPRDNFLAKKKERTELGESLS